MESPPGIESLKKSRREPGVPAPQFVTWTASPMLTIHGHLPEGALVIVTRPRKQGHTTENASR